jgi:hypothetical protein
VDTASQNSTSGYSKSEQYKWIQQVRTVQVDTTSQNSTSGYSKSEQYKWIQQVRTVQVDTASQNSTIWSAENTHAVHENPLRSSKTDVWCAMSRKLTVAPLFFEVTITAETYPRMSTQFVAALQQNESDRCFQRDGATDRTAITTAVL